VGACAQYKRMSEIVVVILEGYYHCGTDNLNLSTITSTHWNNDWGPLPKPQLRRQFMSDSIPQTGKYSEQLSLSDRYCS